MSGKGGVKVGCCGFVVPQKQYFKSFKIIEIQNTFYQLSQVQTAEKWRASAPRDFEFTMKAWQLITHEPTSPTYRRLKEKIDPERYACYGSFRPTPEVFNAWTRTAEFGKALGASVMVFQCPASFRPHPENVDHMKEFFGRADRADFQFAWEPRGQWQDDLVLRLCEELDLVHCVDPFQNKPLQGEFQYFRLHGIGGYAYSYTDEDLAKLSVWAKKKPTLALFNNNTMKEDALRFMKMTA